MIFDNTRYFSMLLKSFFAALIIIILSLLLLSITFAKKWYDAIKADNVYVVFPDQTYVAEKKEGTLVRDEYEIIAFTKLILEKSFEHSEYSLEENLKEASSHMNKESAKMLLSKMDATIESLYKERNAISIIALEEIEINKKTYPHEVIVYYNTFLHFVTAGKTLYEDMEVPGGLYLQLEILPRSHKNPYGLQVKKLKFIQAKNVSDE